MGFALYIVSLSDLSRYHLNKEFNKKCSHNEYAQESYSTTDSYHDYAHSIFLLTLCKRYYERTAVSLIIERVNSIGETIKKAVHLLHKFLLVVAGKRE